MPKSTVGPLWVTSCVLQLCVADNTGAALDRHGCSRQGCCMGSGRAVSGWNARYGCKGIVPVALTILYSCHQIHQDICLHTENAQPRSALKQFSTEAIQPR